MLDEGQIQPGQLGPGRVILLLSGLASVQINGLAAALCRGVTTDLSTETLL